MDIVKYNDIASTNIFEVLNKDASKNLPNTLKESINEVSKIISSDYTLPDIYGKQLMEIPMSQSQFLDICVQFEDHFTPHRKLRQALLELDGRLRSLYAAKDGYSKSIYKMESCKIRIEKLKRQLENATDELEKKEIEASIEFEKRNLDKFKREMRSSLHMVKDAMLKVAMYRKLVEKYEKEVQESGMSFEESEIVYYVMYFSREAEAQLRTMGRVDTGTFRAISQLPEPIRKKVLSNIDFMVQKLKEGYNGDYLHMVYWDLMLPKRTGEGEIEGVKITDLINMDVVKVIASTYENGGKNEDIDFGQFDDDKEEDV